ncbi:MAG TPA: peroxiredoxin-like family protein [Caulobacteraceae bacterium]|jgi:peroxiredoxin|nr:peroxiredoxin-like family protein [Caulobacteraceae bacterium]
MDDRSEEPPHPFAPVGAALEQARMMDAPLSTRLKLIDDAIRGVSGEFAEAAERFVGRLRQVSAGAAAPQVGEAMPPFLLPDDQGKLVGLDWLLGRGPLVIAFHRGHWCPFCSLNAFALVEAGPRLGGAQVIAIAPELQRYARELKAQVGATFPILSDIDNAYALQLNLAIWVEDVLASLIEATGSDIPAYNGADAWVLPIPATFVVNAQGIVTARHIDPDYRQRMDTEALVEAVRRAA